MSSEQATKKIGPDKQIIICVDCDLPIEQIVGRVNRELAEHYDRNERFELQKMIVRDSQVVFTYLKQSGKTVDVDWKSNQRRSENFHVN